MDRVALPAGRLRRGRLATLSLAVVIVVGACGSSSAGGSGGGVAEGDADKIIADAQFAIGTSMVGGEVAGDTITITLVDGFGAGGAKLFMCSNLKKSREKHDPSGSLTIVMVTQSGTQLVSSTDC